MVVIAVYGKISVIIGATHRLHSEPFRAPPGSFSRSPGRLSWSPRETFLAPEAFSGKPLLSSSVVQAKGCQSRTLHQRGLRTRRLACTNPFPSRKPPEATRLLRSSSCAASGGPSRTFHQRGLRTRRLACTSRSRSRLRLRSRRAACADPRASGTLLCLWRSLACWSERAVLSNHSWCSPRAL